MRTLCTQTSRNTNWTARVMKTFSPPILINNKNTLTCQSNSRGHYIQNTEPIQRRIFCVRCFRMKKFSILSNIIEKMQPSNTVSHKSKRFPRGFLKSKSWLCVAPQGRFSPISNAATRKLRPQTGWRSHPLTPLTRTILATSETKTWDERSTLCALHEDNSAQINEGRRIVETMCVRD